jgi:hypothetical protein
MTKFQHTREWASQSPMLRDRDVQEPEAFLAGLADDFAALRADPVAWAEELAEREACDVTLSDGIGDE